MEFGFFFNYLMDTLLILHHVTAELQNAPQNDENFEDAFRDDRDKLE